MITNIHGNVSLKDRITLLAPWICMFIIGVTTIFAFGVRINAKNFLQQVQDQTSAIVLDLEQLRINYFNQLKFIKSIIEDTDFSQKSIDAFFTSNKALVLDRNNIGTILITDQNFNVIYADKFLYSEYSKVTIPNRDYQKQIQDLPDQIIIGSPVIGILTKKIAVPIAIGLQNKNGRFIGAMIFSLPLVNLTRSFTAKYLKDITFTNYNIEDQKSINYEDLQSRYVTTFVTKILFSLDKTYGIVLHHAFGDTNILLHYNIESLRASFFMDYLLLYSTLLVFILLMMWILFNRYILTPILPVILEHTNANIAGSQNIFAKLNSVEAIYRLLKVKASECEQYNERLNAIIWCCNFIASQISNKTKILSEDIEDILQQHNLYETLQEQYKDALNNIYNLSFANSEELKEIMNVMLHTIREVAHTTREDMNIRQILDYIPEIDQNLIVMDYNNAQEERSWKYFKNSLIGALHSIIIYIKGCGNITKIMVSNDTEMCSINFICLRYHSRAEGHAMTLAKCRAFALINYITVKVCYTDNIMAISFQMHRFLP